MSEERRSKARAAVTRPVTIYLNSGKKAHAYIIDLGETGIAIKSVMPAEIGAKLVFKFNLALKNKKT